jgi:hypothetical protein
MEIRPAIMMVTQLRPALATVLRHVLKMLGLSTIMHATVLEHVVTTRIVSEPIPVTEIMHVLWSKTVLYADLSEIIHASERRLAAETQLLFLQIRATHPVNAVLRQTVQVAALLLTAHQQAHHRHGNLQDVPLRVPHPQRYHQILPQRV